MRALVALVLIALAAPGAGAAPNAATPSGKGSAAHVRQLKAIVRAWSKRLNERDDDGAAHLFLLPAVVIQSDPRLFHTYEDLAEWHSRLPCGGRIASIVVKGRFATAVLKLRDRPGPHCDARGILVAARFEIVRGLIEMWEQVAVPPHPGA